MRRRIRGESRKRRRRIGIDLWELEEHDWLVRFLSARPELGFGRDCGRCLSGGRLGLRWPWTRMLFLVKEEACAALDLANGLKGG
jgi:hypothetical protein